MNDAVQINVPYDVPHRPTVLRARGVCQWYDSNAIFSGSATIDEAGDPVITYPGLCPPPPVGSCRTLPGDRVDS
jgi:hypothetical protein